MTNVDPQRRKRQTFSEMERQVMSILPSLRRRHETSMDDARQR